MTARSRVTKNTHPGPRAALPCAFCPDQATRLVAFTIRARPSGIPVGDGGRVHARTVCPAHYPLTDFLDVEPDAILSDVEL